MNSHPALYRRSCSHRDTAPTRHVRPNAIARSLLVRCLMIAATMALARSASPPGAAAFRFGTVLVGDGKMLRDVVLTIRGDRIAAIVPAGDYVSDGAAYRDYSDKVVMPGLFDLHVHVTHGWRESVGQSFLPLRVGNDPEVISWQLHSAVAYGVTTVLDIGAFEDRIWDLKRASQSNDFDGPRILACGPLFEGESPWFVNSSVRLTSEDAARAETRRVIAAGADCIKVYATLPAKFIVPITEEAHRAGRKVLAHVSAASWREAIDAGVDAIVHIQTAGPFNLLPAVQATSLRPHPRLLDQLFQHYRMMSVQSNAIATLIARMKAKGVALNPTLAVWHNILVARDPAQLAQQFDRSLLARVPPHVRAGWDKELPRLIPDATLTVEYQRDYETQWRALFATMAREGVRLLIGSDFGANPYTVPGAALHQEMKMLVQAGIPPGDVLKMATRDAAEWLERAKDYGTVESGKIADLLILNGDPLGDITQTMNISAVIRGGRVLRP